MTSGAGVRPLQVVEAEVAQVHDADLMAARDELRDEHRAEVAGAARDEDSHARASDGAAADGPRASASASERVGHASASRPR